LSQRLNSRPSIYKWVKKKYNFGLIDGKV
jgi:hypothetical protein